MVSTSDRSCYPYGPSRIRTVPCSATTQKEHGPLVRAVNESRQAGVPVTVSTHGTVLTGLLVAEETYFANLVEASRTDQGPQQLLTPGRQLSIGFRSGCGRR